ncbi:glyoxalase superfamily protein [Nocardia mexicana]|uniref:Catechol 2,3-dioxygenase-like lactoylglutathione lyase family enzyme n=1 Tax=Nocardia mexicana TaxID=279262 RepID=A0A370GM50_9NOCA|nr:glyoxalase superfamily protein [Nocardia mexicana]RDI44440.1 catechol 2,3-dioxygenase-like lactoylglutathione lyase family enzyme [Nocardia mexicana]
MQIAIVSVPVRDQDKATAFYSDKLGFTVVSDDPMGPDSRWVMLAPPEGGAAITLVTWFPTMPPGSLKGLVYAVADLDRIRTELIGKGVAVGEVEDTPWGVRLAQFDDIDGNGIVLQETVPAPK